MTKVSVILRFIISFGLLGTLIWIMRDDAGKVIDILKNSNKIFFIIAVSINIPLVAVVSYRLKLLMGGQEISLSLKDAIYLVFIGFFFNNFLPTAIGGDIVKAHYASKKTNKKAASYAAVIVDRLIGFLSCLSLALIGIIFIGKDLNNNKIIWAVIVMTVLLISFIFLLLNKKDAGSFLGKFARKGITGKVREKLSKLYNAINLYRHNLIILVKTFLLGVFMQVCTAVSIYFFILCLGGSIALFKLFLIVPLVWAVSMLPSLNGLGVREGAFVYFLKGDIGMEMAFAISILWLGILMMYSVVGGILHLFGNTFQHSTNEVGKCFQTSAR